ncbi:hypothetical protein QQX98_012989 [Neonectria punicea]|uniref:Uncharacterized protein n=1 Tax=Neonectria punicea TaxID=979145 RepID=A0ABR1GHE7_9HYPO
MWEAHRILERNADYQCPSCPLVILIGFPDQLDRCAGKDWISATADEYHLLHPDHKGGTSDLSHYEFSILAHVRVFIDLTERVLIDLTGSDDDP